MRQQVVIDLCPLAFQRLEFFSVTRHQTIIAGAIAASFAATSAA